MPEGDTKRGEQAGTEGVGFIIHMMKQLSGMKPKAQASQYIHFLYICHMTEWGSTDVLVVI